MASLKTIYINGNSVEPTLHGPGLQLSALDVPDATATKYIIVQTDGILSPAQKEELKQAGVVIQNYISEYTYLCEYDPSDLETLRSRPFVNYANVYLPELKINAKLKISRPTITSTELSGPPEQDIDITFHKGVDASTASIKAAVAAKANVQENDMIVSARKIRLKTRFVNLSEIASVDEVKAIEEVVQPILFNNVARGIIDADVLVNNTPYEGQGQVVAVADTGFDLGSESDVHPAFSGRVAKLYPLARPPHEDDPGNSNDPHSHGTHVCGSVLGDGHSDRLNIDIKGAAPKATLVMQSVGDDAGRLIGIPADLTDLFRPPYENDGARVHTNSWGLPFPSDHVQRDYDSSNAEIIDEFVHKYKDMTICFAAGNDGMDLDSNGIVDLAQIGAHASAKNIITVGASENLRPDYPAVYANFANGPVNFPVNPLNKDPIANNAEGMAALSSRGPTKGDGRIKPDLVAPGTAILSSQTRTLTTTDSYSRDRLWCVKSGTSMATPLVAGCAAVLREVLVNNGLPKPTAALIKTLLINGAVNMTGQYQTADVGASPNGINGWGRVNLAGSVIVPSPNEENAGLGEGEPLKPGEEHTIVIDIPDKPIKKGDDVPKIGGDIQRVDMENPVASDDSIVLNGVSLKMTIGWTDPPGPLLQNNLNLIVLTATGEERHGNMGTSLDFDRANNVEQILWKNIPAGKTKLIIRCEYVNVGDSQDYAYAWRIS